MLVRSAVVGGSGSGLRGRMLDGWHRELWRRGEKEEKSGMCVGWLWISSAEIWLLKVATLSVKKLTKSSAV